MDPYSSPTKPGQVSGVPDSYYTNPMQSGPLSGPMTFRGAPAPMHHGALPTQPVSGRRTAQPINFGLTPFVPATTGDLQPQMYPAAPQATNSGPRLVSPGRSSRSNKVFPAPPTQESDPQPPATAIVDEPQPPAANDFAEIVENEKSKNQSFSVKCLVIAVTVVAILILAGVLGAVCGTGLCRGTSSPASSSAALSVEPIEVWATGTVTDANNSAPLEGVVITGSRGTVLSTPSGAYSMYAPVVNGRVVVAAQGFGNYTPQTGTAVVQPGVNAYVIPIMLNRISFITSFSPVSGLNATAIPGSSGGIRVYLPPLSPAVAALLPSSVALSIAVISPASSPGLMESAEAGAISNSTTLQSVGMFYIDLRDSSGSSLAFPTGFSPRFSFDAFNFSADIDSDPVAWFSFNATSGKWVNPVPIVPVSSSRRLQSAADVAAMAAGYWNAAAENSVQIFARTLDADRNPRLTCVLASVTLGGQPCAGARVAAVGPDSITSYGTSDSSGTVCVEGAAGWRSSVSVSGVPGYSYITFPAGTQGLTSGVPACPTPPPPPTKTPSSTPTMSQTPSSSAAPAIFRFTWYGHPLNCTASGGASNLAECLAVGGSGWIDTNKNQFITAPGCSSSSRIAVSSSGPWAFAPGITAQAASFGSLDGDRAESGSFLISFSDCSASIDNITVCITCSANMSWVAAPTPTVTPSQAPTLSNTRTPTRTSSNTPSQAPSFAGLSPGAYSGTGLARDNCARGLLSLYAFGSAAADSVASKGDDFSYTISWIGAPFLFYGTAYNTIYPSSNGAIFFGSSSAAYSNVPFPAYVGRMIAVWWCDVSTSSFVNAIPNYVNAIPNNIYYRFSTSPSAADAARIAADVAASLPWEATFSPSFMTVITWFAVGRFGDASPPTALNTFQVVLASDWNGRSFVTMCYDNLPWDTNNGATVGFNANDGVRSFSLPGSYSSPADKLLSCGGRRGCYTYRVDGGFVVDASGSSTPSVSSSNSRSQTRSSSLSPSRSWSSSNTKSPSRTSSNTPSSSRTSSNTPSSSRTSSNTPTISWTSSATMSQAPSFAGLPPGAYSGTGLARDNCSRGLTSLYAFGNVAADNITIKGDDFAYTITWTGTPFLYYGTAYNIIYPSSNGAIFFGYSSTTYSNVPFPAYVGRMIAVWWCDVSTSSFVNAIPNYVNSAPNNIYYRFSTSPSAADAARIAADVAASLPWEATFSPSFMTVITWFAVGRFGDASPPTAQNTFQVALASDSNNRSFVTMCYDNLPWDTNNGATVGFNANDGVRSFSLPGSFSSPADKLLSCGGRGGCYTYRVDNVVESNPTPTQTVSTSVTSTVSLSSSNTPTLSWTASNTPTVSWTSSDTPTVSWTSSNTPSQAPSFVGLSPGAYSGAGLLRDNCSRGLASLYAFGIAAADNKTQKALDAAFAMSWVGTPFTFYGVPYNLLYTGIHGAIFFGAASTAWINVPFPAALVAPMIAVWWCDVSTVVNVTAIPGYTNAEPNNIYYRVTTSPSAADAARIATDVAASLPSEPSFSPSFMAVFTWFAVGKYGDVVPPSSLNTFQAVLASDSSNRSFVTLCYDNLPWDQTNDTFSATVGFNANDGVRSFSLPGSYSSPADKLLSCGGRTGCYTYRVDGPVVFGASSSPSASYTPSVTGTYVPSGTSSGSTTQTRSTTVAASSSSSGTPSPGPFLAR